MAYSCNIHLLLFEESIGLDINYPNSHQRFASSQQFDSIGDNLDLSFPVDKRFSVIIGAESPYSE